MARRLPFHYVYKLYGADNSLLYVGESANPGNRMDSHLEKWWGVNVCRVELEKCQNSSDAKELEARLIHELGPTYNVMHNISANKTARVLADLTSRPCDLTETQDDTVLGRVRIPSITHPTPTKTIYTLMTGREPTNSEIKRLSSMLRKDGWVNRATGGKTYWGPTSSTFHSGWTSKLRNKGKQQ